MMQGINNDTVPSPNEKYQIGDEVDVKVTQITESGFVLTVPAILQSHAPAKKASTEKSESPV